MKKTAIVAFTEQGNALGSRLQDLLKDCDVCDRYSLEKYRNTQVVLSEGETVCQENSKSDATQVFFFENGKELMQKIFCAYDQILMIAACGIVVRLLDGLLRGKEVDPAVVVMDVQGRFAIPLLSGHWGGANAFARKISKLMGAIPVITTATDSCGCFSPDLFAKANHLTLTDLKGAKRVAAAALEGRKIGVISEWPVIHAPEGMEVVVLSNVDRGAKKRPVSETTIESITEAPAEVIREAAEVVMEADALIWIGTTKMDWMRDNREVPPLILRMIPQDIVLGVGCRRNLSPEVFKREVLHCMEKYGLDTRRVRALHSISLKKEEKAFRELAKEYRWESRFFSAEELKQAEGTFSKSVFVEAVTGVDNVCERSAVMTGGSLIVEKTVGEGITFAAARLEMVIDLGKS